jgi:NhaP-type Na+/H+ or K+/H+ antiporter
LVLLVDSGGFIILFGLASFKIKERLYLSEAFVATVFGVLIGPAVLGLMKDSMFGDRVDQMMLEISRVVLGIQCFTAGIESPGKLLQKEKQSMFMLLGPVLLFMWGISTLIVSLVFQISWRDGMIIAACITPTDPILASVSEIFMFALNRLIS